MSLDRLEDDLEETSRVAQLVRPPAQYLLAAWLGAGNEQAYPGRAPWLFYRQDLDYLTTDSCLDEAHRAILHFRAQLDARGIQLIVMPTPVKPTVHPERFSRHFERWPGPLQAAAYPALIRALARMGVLVFDPAGTLVEAKQETGIPQYLVTDTHWRPEAVQLTAERLRDFIAQHSALPAVTGGRIYRSHRRGCQPGRHHSLARPARTPNPVPRGTGLPPPDPDSPADVLAAPSICGRSGAGRQLQQHLLTCRNGMG